MIDALSPTPSAGPTVLRGKHLLQPSPKDNPRTSPPGHIPRGTRPAQSPGSALKQSTPEVGTLAFNRPHHALPLAQPVALGRPHLLHPLRRLRLHEFVD